MFKRIYCMLNSLYNMTIYRLIYVGLSKVNNTNLMFWRNRFNGEMAIHYGGQRFTIEALL